MPGDAKLKVVAGPCAGREIIVPAGGRVRAGRSSGNDFPIADLSVSRFHCLFFFKPGEGFHIADLGSANQTMVNGEPVQERPLKRGDKASLGDTVIEVVDDGLPKLASAQPAVQPAPETAVSAPAAQPVAAPPAAAAAAGAETPVASLDLGLAAKPAAQKSRTNVRFLAVLVILALVAVLAVWIPKFIGKAKNNGGTRKPVKGSVIVDPVDLYVRYEKIDGTSSNIFKYLLLISDGNASLEVHDLAGNRHLARPSTPMQDDILVRLARDIQDSGFMALLPEYRGRTPGVFCRSDITVTLGLRNHRVVVFNAVDPEPFDAVKKMLESFGQNEFRITAFAKSREELLKLAGDAWELARKIYGERTVRYGNLHAAIGNAKLAELYVETMDPKPGFYEELVSARQRWQSELEKEYGDMRFQAERAMNIKDWREAMATLGIILEMIPDSLDPRNKKAQADMVSAQRHLEDK